MNILEYEAQDRAEQERLTLEVFDELVDFAVDRFRSWFDIDQSRFYTCEELRDIASEKMVRKQTPRFILPGDDRDAEEISRQ